MAFKSKAQQRYMFSAEARGELKPGTAREWAHETPDIKKLPERVGDDEKKKKKRHKGVKEALDKYALNLSEINPHVLGAVLGGGTGALLAPEDHRLAGAAVGAGLGGALGVHHWAKKPPPPKQLLPVANQTPEVWPPAVYYEHDIKDVNKLGAWQALEKFAAFTPAFIRIIARDGDVEIDQPEFKEKCRGLTGVAHLDKMSSGQLGQVAKMLWSSKQAADIATLQRAVARAGVPTVKRLGDPRLPIVQGAGAAFLPPSRVATQPEMVAPTLAAMGIPVDSPIAAMVQKNMRSPEFRGPVDKRSGPVQTPGGVSRALMQQAPHMLPPSGLTGEGQRAVNITSALHEVFERQASKKPLLPGWGHLSPDVVMKEHNLLQKMTGPGAEAAAHVFDNIRGPSEQQQLVNAAVDRYGPQAAEVIAEHGFTSAMRKNLLKHFRAGVVPWGATP